MDFTLDPEYEGPPTLSLCLNCMQPFTMNLPPSAPKLESDQAENGSDPAYLISYKFNTRNPETGREEIKSVDLTNIEVLTYIFELSSSEISRLIDLQVNSMLMCRQCTKILASIFKARDEFQQLTSNSSCLNSIVSRSRSHHQKNSNPSVQIKDKSRMILSSRVRSEPNASSTYRTEKTRMSKGHQIKVIVTKILDQSPSIKPKPCIGDLMEVEGVLFSGQQIDRNRLQHEELQQASSNSLQLPDEESNTVIKLEPDDADCLSEITTCSTRLHVSKQTSNIQLGETEETSDDINESVVPVSPLNSTVEDFKLIAPNEEAESEGQDSHSHKSTLHVMLSNRLKKRDRPKKDVRLRKRNRQNQPKKEVICQQCGEVFHTPNPVDVLRQHNESKHGQTPAHPCDICGKPCQRPSSLKTHRLSHFAPDEKTGLTFLCPECGKQISTERYLKIHISRAHRGFYKYPEYNCKKCGSKSRSMRSHNIHMRRHEIEEGDKYYFFCKVCPAKFKFKKELLMHHPSCPGEAHLRPHVCPECSRRFKLKQSLELHLNEVHKYDAIAAREFVYPGLGPRKFLTKAEWKRKQKESQT